jgi:hypothetical protein
VIHELNYFAPTRYGPDIPNRNNGARCPRIPITAYDCSLSKTAISYRSAECPESDAPVPGAGVYAFRYPASSLREGMTYSGVAK